MDAIEALLTRRSIRKYRPKNVSPEIINQLLEVAMQAPSARNYQPWYFFVVTAKEILNAIPKFHEYADMLRSAPAAIVICGDRVREPNIDYIVQACSAATENILLAAHALGLGAVWLGLFPREKRMLGIKKLLELPDNIIPMMMVPVGYPDEKKPLVKRFEKTRIYFNKWEKTGK